MALKLRSLRVRLCVLYCCVTMAGLCILGAASYLYLRHTLESARSATLQRRTDRMVRFLQESARGEVGGNTAPYLSEEQLSEQLHRFIIASPDTEQLQVVDARSGRRYVGPVSTNFAWPAGPCASPCIRLVVQNGHRMRLLQQSIPVDGRVLQVSMAGQVDEHDDTLRTVLGSYVLILPLALLGSLGGGLWLGGMALRPIDRLTRVAAEIGIQDLSQRLPVPQTGDEIERLAETWNDLLCRLESAVTQLQQFTSDISHDLRTAVTVMLASVEVALRRERTAEAYKQTLHTVAMECRATARLLDDLLDASGAGNNGSRRHELVPLSEVVAEACDLFAGRLVEKSQYLDRTIAQDRWVHGDVQLLRRLIIILLDNAVKYTPPCGQIGVLLHSAGQRTELCVSDTGIGMTPEVQAQVFHRFFRADRARGREQGGNGLGLAIAKRIVEAHSGELCVSSQAGVGSSFRVSFPPQPLLR